MRSMTGYGSASAVVSGGRLVAEIRSVNARFLDLKLVVPREYVEAEADLRELVQGAVERGRVDLVVRREGGARRSPKMEVDVELARAYVEAWKRVQRSLGLAGQIDVGFLRGAAGDVVRRVEAAADPASERPALKRAVKGALAAHKRDREREGKTLAADMAARLKALDVVRRECTRQAEAMRGVLARRLTDRVSALLGGSGPDPARIVQEVALAVDRSDFSEELTRLGSHIAALRALLGDRGPVGKRVEFLLQEMLREVNTIGSKANQLEVTQAVLRGKSELEKLREQAANVE
jgi:uncharacterized protein (TIGR00255 family)